MKNWILSLLFLFFILFPFGQLARVDIGSGVVIQPIDVITGIIAFSWILSKVFSKTKAQPSIAIPFLSFFTVSLFSLVLMFGTVGNHDFFVGFLYWLRIVAYGVLYFAVFDISRKDEGMKKKLLDSLITVGTVVAIFGWLQYLFVPDLRVFSEFGWDDHYGRLVGTFLDPSFSGILLVFFTIAVLLRKWGRAGELYLFPILAFLGISGVAFTYSRASYLALLAGFIAFYIVRRNLKEVLFAIGVFTLVLLLLPHPFGEGVRLQRTASISSRIENFTSSLILVENNPIFGIGFNLYKPVAIKTRLINSITSQHSGSGIPSTPLFILVTTGIAGAISIFFLLFKIFEKAWKNRKTEIGSIVFVSLAALTVHFLFNNSLFYPWVMGWFFILVGVLDQKVGKTMD